MKEAIAFHVEGLKHVPQPSVKSAYVEVAA